MLDQSINMASFRFKSFMFLLTLFGMYARIDSTCTAPWVSLGLGVAGTSEKCVRIFQARQTYGNAMTTCQQSQSGFQPKLASISSQDEDLMLHTYIDTEYPQNIPKFIWMGLEPEIEVVDNQGVTSTVDARGTKFEWTDNSDYEPVKRTGQKAVALFLPGINQPGLPKYVLVDASIELPFVCMHIP
ncbi:hypothetical protein HOLleu_38046 [Holothuria leucospilota]|uniref:C-type lectin domain-containing protein n=1 Tax=Holothuria leucospilota TaxID=206669 RepID=A0A9Q0YMP0_HOLLE|nr:hypothetical protein HOLleu_38046 [Holothuria leucospilota]